MTEANPADIASLFSPSPDDVIETHISKVFLSGDRAWKLKKAVRLPYVDFSTLEKRRVACEREVSLNRRTASDLYLGTRAVYRTGDGSLSFTGAGQPVEWLVEMRRFDSNQTFDRLVHSGGLAPETMDAVAETIARFHAGAEIVSGSQETPLARPLRLNAEAFAKLEPSALPPEDMLAFSAALEAEMERRRDLLAERQRRGMVRRCHGDLHLRNIVLTDNRPVLFDCLEFDDDLAAGDTMYDFAFLLMDLLQAGRGDLANRCLNRYLEISDDYEGAALLPLYIAVRAAIRCHIAGLDVRSRDEARRYLALARASLVPASPRLVVVAGLSGTGKTTVARRIAPRSGTPCGAIVLRSDVIRKRLHGVEPTQRLPADAYTEQASRQTYAALLARADQVLRGGASVILDAVFGLEREREAAEALARSRGADFLGLWLEAPLGLLSARIEGRRNDASDATVEIVQRQAEMLAPPIHWHHLDAAAGVDRVSAAAARLLTQAGP